MDDGVSYEKDDLAVYAMQQKAQSFQPALHHLMSKTSEDHCVYVGDDDQGNAPVPMCELDRTTLTRYALPSPCLPRRV